ncbi:MAG: hypothetical protein J2P45_05880 [Candidatus Dormibacteraeota bacterium]|nr:hypothetical protein [Candidatus Dormibacteraeota bacterium]
MEPEKLPDVWYSLDRPVLLEAARWEVADKPGDALPVEAVAQAVGRPVERVLGSLARLAADERIDLRTQRGGGRLQHATVLGVLPAGLREVGPWPKGEDLAAGLREVLEAQVRLLERLEPERGAKARKVLELLADIGTDFAAKLAAELVKSQLPHL